jgi:two-component system nitrogen regulation sensor histidine kinase NtrY
MLQGKSRAMLGIAAEKGRAAFGEAQARLPVLARAARIRLRGTARLAKAKLRALRRARQVSSGAPAPEAGEGGANQNQPGRFQRYAYPLSLAVVVSALLSSVATFFILSGLTPILPTHYVVVTTLLVNAALVVAIIAIVSYQILKLLRARKRQTAGAGLHFRIAGIFSLVALFPAVLLAIFATVSIDRTFEQIFSARVKSIVANSVEVANAYLAEHGQVIRAEMIGTARELEENAALYKENRDAFLRFFSAQVALRSIPSAYLLDRSGEIIAASSDEARYAYRAPPAAALARADEGRVIMVGPEYANGVGALKKLANVEGLFFYAIRPVNPEVIALLQRTQANVNQFGQLEQRRSIVQFVFAAMYVVLAFTLLMSAIWIGLGFANRLVAPIRRLIAAAQEVSQGNLNVKLEEGSASDDIGKLRDTFKRMTVDLKTQRDDLVSANSMLVERRRFIEAMLSGVSAGVIGLDVEGRVTLVNRSALELLGLQEERIVGRRLVEVLPEFEGLLDRPGRQPRKPAQTQVTLVRETGERNFAVRVTRERSEKREGGIVVTFDDVTELTVAQRTSAWADVARRIAHEIKNPLTPIQLSAERIRRKYADSITTDREIFDRCTETIIRHVGDIGRMVDEFSSFARMPNAVFEEHDIREILKEAVILFQMSRSDIDFSVRSPDRPVIALCDRRLLTQAITNLVKNACEAIESYQQAANGEAQRGRVEAELTASDHRFLISVLDNGCGLPKENRHRLIEPYITTRQKGTGLGLAIVQRITEQHGGTLDLSDAPGAEGDSGQHGALVRLSLPLSLAAEPSQTSQPPREDQQRKSRTRQQPEKRPARRGKVGMSHGG